MSLATGAQLAHGRGWVCDPSRQDAAAVRLLAQVCGVWAEEVPCRGGVGELGQLDPWHCMDPTCNQ